MSEYKVTDADLAAWKKLITGISDKLIEHDRLIVFLLERAALEGKHEEEGTPCIRECKGDNN